MSHEDGTSALIANMLNNAPPVTPPKTKTVVPVVPPSRTPEENAPTSTADERNEPSEEVAQETESDKQEVSAGTNDHSSEPPAAPLAPPQPPAEPPVQPAAPRPVRAAKKTTAQAPKPVAKKPAKATAKRPVNAADPNSDTNKWGVRMDRDLVPLIALARAATGQQVADVLLEAAAEYCDVAAFLPDAPDGIVVVNERYGITKKVPHHRPVMTPYMPPEVAALLDADAEAAWLDRSTFLQRVVRAHLAYNRVFVPTRLVPSLYQHPEQVLEALAQVGSRPARQLPHAKGEAWTMVTVDGPLREALHGALEELINCDSVTQALLTVLL